MLSSSRQSRGTSSARTIAGPFTVIEKKPRLDVVSTDLLLRNNNYELQKNFTAHAWFRLT
jgi:hypothetical protein